MLKQYKENISAIASILVILGMLLGWFLKGQAAYDQIFKNKEHNEKIAEELDLRTTSLESRMDAELAVMKSNNSDFKKGIENKLHQIYIGLVNAEIIEPSQIPSPHED